MNLISIRKLKFYTKETLKLFNIALVAFGFIIAIILIKYKPMYEVKISGEEVGYVENKKALNETIENNVENYNSKVIDKVKLTENPEYELKLVEKTQEDNESEVVIALQRKLEITYKYYEIALNEEVIEKVDTIETAEQIVDEIKDVTDEKTVLTINEKTTKNIEEMNTNNIEIAKNNIIKKLDIDTTKAISDINGIKIAVLPVSGKISSRYGVSSRIRSSTHTGLDIAAPKGTPIKVIADGTITSAKYTGSYGNLVKVQHENGVESWYAHASKINVTVGQKVKAGDVIALVGSTGNSTGAHLHLEIRIDGEHVNPQNYLYK
ncbi:MAG: peptidoglycan DD-metalloendopeptidase family protein [Clostridia bacterium]|nr:peptidoglycan DD-metalloendopeptidase family protein [Clostridia bacterium]